MRFFASRLRADVAGLPVLWIGSDGVEWLDDGAAPALRTTREVEPNASVRLLVRRAAELVRSAGDRPRACVLVLGTGFLEQKILALPPIKGRDLRQVLGRKAATLIGSSPSDMLFSAVALGSESSGQATPETRWCLRAVRRTTVRALFQALRDEGFRAARTVWERSATLAGAPITRSGSAESASIVLAVEPLATVVSLCHGLELVHQTVLSGNLLAQPSLGAAALQAAKSLDAFWRKESRGQKVEGIALVGLDAKAADQVLPALHAAFPQTALCTAPLEPGSAEEARIATLIACRQGAGRETSLRVHVPPRRRTLAAALLACALSVGLPLLARDRLLRARQDAWLTRARDLRTQVADLPAIRDEHTQKEELVSRLAQERERVSAVGSQGIPFVELLEEGVSAFHGRGALLSYSYGRATGVRLSGLTAAHPGESRQALEGIGAHLEQSPLLFDVQIQLPTGIPADDGPDQALSFALTAREGWR